MTTETIVNKLRELKLLYIQQHLGSNPALLNEHLAEFLGYATIMFDFYGDTLAQLERMEAKVTKEEEDYRVKANKLAVEAGEKPTVTQAEVDKRIAIRLAELSANKKRLEQIVKGATLHINGIQSILKRAGDESKGLL